MNLDELKRSLVAQGTAVTPLRSPLHRAVWAIIFLTTLALAISFLNGVRPSLSELLSSWGFLAQLCSLLLLGGYSAYLALAESIPGEPYLMKKRGWLAVLTFLAIGSVLLFAPDGEPVTILNNPEYLCPLALLTVGALLAPVMVTLLRLGVPISPGWNFLSAALTCTTFGAFSLHLVCARSSYQHLLCYHLLPAIGAALLIGLLVSALRR